MTKCRINAKRQLKAWMLQQTNRGIEIDDTIVLVWVTQRNQQENVTKTNTECTEENKHFIQ